MEERYQLDNLVLLMQAIVQHAERDAGKGNEEAADFLRELRSPVATHIPYGRQRQTGSRQWAVYRDQRRRDHVPFRNKVNRRKL